MPNYANIKDGIVTNVIIADSLEEANKVFTDGQVLESTTINPAFIGGKYRDDIKMFCYPDTDIPTVTQELMDQHFNSGHELSPIINDYIDKYTETKVEE